MADTNVSKPKEPPKPVHIGGESIVDRLLPHMKKIIWGVLILSLVVSVVFGIRWWKHRGEAKETEKLAVVFAEAQRPIVSPPPAAGSGAPPPAPDPKRDGFTSTQERAKAVLEAMRKQGVTPPSHAYRAGVLLESGDIDGAIAEYKRGQDTKGIEGVLAREGLGVALEAKAAAEKDAAARGKLLEEALAVYQRMQPDAKGPRHVYAIYHQGRLQAALGKNAEAKALFQKAEELLAQEPIHELQQMLDRRLAALGG